MDALWIAAEAPAQFVSGAAYPFRHSDFGGQEGESPGVSAMNPFNQGQGGPAVGGAWGLASTIALALLTVFMLQKLGFRFVVGAGIGR